MRSKRPCRSVIALCLAGALAACGDDGGTWVDLTSRETIPVAFGTMEGGVVEGIAVELADLTGEPDFVDVRDLLECAWLDLGDSAITIDALDVGQFATPFDYQLGVAPRGGQSFEPLARFSGPIAEGQRIRFSDSGFQVFEGGLALIAEVLLGAQPALDLEIRGEVPARIEDLTVSLTLTIRFSNTSSECR